MEIEFQNTTLDVQAVMRRLPLGRRLWLRYGWIAQLYACTLPGTVILLLLGDFLIPLAGWTLLGLLALTRMVALRSGETVERPLPRMRLRLRPEYLECQTDRGCGRRDWRRVRRVEQTPDYLLLHLVQQRVFAIPARAFASEREMREAARLVEAHTQAAAAREAEVREAPVRDVADGGSPTPIPPPRDDLLRAATERVVVRFRNTARQIVDVRQYGLQRPTSRWTSGLLLLFLTAVMAVFLAYGQQARGPERMLANVLFLSLSGFAGLWSWTFLRPLWEARQVPAEVLLPLQLTITPGGAWLRSEAVASFEEWSGFRSCLESERYVALVRREARELVVIPRSAFDDSAHERRFVEMARAAIDRAEAAGGERESGEAERPLVETGNPYQPPSL